MRGEGSNLQAALDYAAREWPVLPLIGKRPLISGWPEKASTDPDTIREWFDRFPSANVGILTGKPSGFLGLDVDGDAGRESIDGKPIPPTPTVETGNGLHYYFRTPDGRDVRSVTGIMDGLDLKAAGGYVVAPPSEHPNGGRYEWIIPPEDAPLSEAPQWLVKRLKYRDDPNHEESPEANSTTGRPVRIEASESEVSPSDFWKRRNHGEAAEDTQPGQRNERTYRTKLTWVNAGLPPGQFDRWFLSDVLPELDTGPGHDGEPFTEDEAREALRNAEKEKYKVRMPEDLRDYFTRSGGSSRPVKEPRCSWQPYELRRAVVGFLHRRGSVQYDSRDGGCYEQLAADLRAWIDRAWSESKAPPERTLRKVLRTLDDAGLIDRKTGRRGDGSATLRLRYTGPSKPHGKPQSTNNGFPRLTPRATRETSSDSPGLQCCSSSGGSDPPNRGDPGRFLPEILAALDSQEGLTARGSTPNSGFSGDSCTRLERKKRRLRKMLEDVDPPDVEPGPVPF